MPSALDRKVPAPDGWPYLWVSRELPALNYYTLALLALLAVTIIYVHISALLALRRLRKEPITTTSDAAAQVKKIEACTRGYARTHFKIGCAFIANALLLIGVDGLIGLFVLVKDVSTNPAAYDKEMLVSIALYVVYLLVLFVGSFILAPLLQMMALTWALRRFGQKNRLSDYVPQARIFSSIIAQAFALNAFSLVCNRSIVASDSQSEASMRFVVLEAVWGSALAWLEASFIFNYLSHAIGDKELNSGNGVGEVSNTITRTVVMCPKSMHQIVSMFAKAATAPLRKSKQELLPTYQKISREEPTESTDPEKQAV